jgi:hypothetical protein
MKTLNLRKLQIKVQKNLNHNEALLRKTRKKLEQAQILNTKLVALDELLKSLLAGKPGLSQQLEVALNHLEELNLESGS